MTVSVQMQGKFQVRSVKDGNAAEGQGQFATLNEYDAKYPVAINVAMPQGAGKLVEGEYVDFSMAGTYRVFSRDGRNFVTLFVDDFRADRFVAEFKSVGQIGTPGGKGLLGGASAVSGKNQAKQV